MANSLEIDPRLYDLVRQQSIRTVPEALVEVITNSIDAYNSVETAIDGSEVTGLPIDIYVDGNLITVKDRARGLTSTEITNKIIKVGSLTAEITSRGLMGRGAKDITNIGNIRFVTIRNNALSEIKINQDTTYEWVKQDVPVISQDRQTYGLLGNGMIVYINVSPLVQVFNGDVLASKLSKNLYLRNILLEGSHPIKVNGKVLTYEYPEGGKKIVDIEFPIEGYEGATASFTIYSVLNMIPNPKSPDELEYGILISGDNSVYECGGVYAEGENFIHDYRWNSNLKYIYGELRCNHISNLAREITTVGKTDKNPFMILDPSRRGGLSKKHPFTKALYDIPYRWLEITLNRIQDIHEDFMLTTNDVNDFLDNISRFLKDNMQFENVLYTWRSKGDQEILNSMTGKLTKLEVDKEVMNIDSSNVSNILSGKNLVPVPIVNNSKPNVEIKISDDPTLTDPYDVVYFSDRIIIKINANDESLTPFVTIEPTGENDNSIITVNGEGAMVSISDTLREAMIHMLTRQTVMSNEIPTDSDTNNYNEIRTIQSNIRKRISKQTAMLYKQVHSMYEVTPA